MAYLAYVLMCLFRLLTTHNSLFTLHFSLSVTQQHVVE